MAEPGRSTVASPIVGLMNQFEFAMLGEGADPALVQRVCNRMLFGHPDGSAAWQRGGPQRYVPVAGADSVLKELAARPGLTELDLAAIRRVRHLLYGGDPDGDVTASRSGVI